MRAHRSQYFPHTQTSPLCTVSKLSFRFPLYTSFYLFSLLSLGLPIVFYLLDECLESIPRLRSNEVEGNIYAEKEEVQNKSVAKLEEIDFGEKLNCLFLFSEPLEFSFFLQSAYLSHHSYIYISMFIFLHEIFSKS
jgi:hypothetical protein